MTYEQLVEWVYEHTDNDDYKSKDTLVKNIRDDWKGTVTDWVENEGYTGGNSVYVNKIQKKIDDYNDEYLSRIQDQILSSNRIEEIESITPGTGYEEGTAEEIENIKRDAIENIRGNTATALQSIDDIRAARTIEEIDRAIGDSPSTGSVRKRDPALASELSMAIAEATERKYDLEHPTEVG